MAKFCTLCYFSPKLHRLKRVIASHFCGMRYINSPLLDPPPHNGEYTHFVITLATRRNIALVPIMYLRPYSTVAIIIYEGSVLPTFSCKVTEETDILQMTLKKCLLSVVEHIFSSALIYRTVYS